MKRLLACLLLLNLSSAFAMTDYQCVNDCTKAGYQYGLCQSRCSTAPDPQETLPQNPDPWNDAQTHKQTDYQCVNDCTAKGYQYQLCQSKCSY